MFATAAVFDHALPLAALDIQDASRPPSALAPLVDSKKLLNGFKTIEINHNGSIYRLQATRLGKLILTK